MLTLFAFAAVQAGCSKWPTVIENGGPPSQNSISTPNKPRSLRASETSIPAFISANDSVAAAKSDFSPLETRQDSCMSWTQAPNSTVCCDHSSGQWVDTGVQRDSYTIGGPACVKQEADVTVDGETVASNIQVTQAATTTTSLIQEDYCSEAMQAPNATVCCDMSSGLWAPAPVIRDGPATGLVSAACPSSKDGGGNVNY